MRLIWSILMMSIIAQSSITDFKTIQSATDAYRAGDFNKSKKLFSKLDEAIAKRVKFSNSKESSTELSSSTLLHKNFSKREYEVFLDIARGVKPLNIAQKYNIKSKTVSTYRKRILEKMGVNSNTEIIRYAIMHALI